MIPQPLRLCSSGGYLLSLPNTFLKRRSHQLAQISSNLRRRTSPERQRCTAFSSCRPQNSCSFSTQRPRLFNNNTNNASLPKALSSSTSGNSRTHVPFRRGGTINLPDTIHKDALVHVSAFHIAQTIDLPKAAASFMSTHKQQQQLERADRKNTTIFKYRDTEKGNPQFFCVYPYGSLVFFNMRPSQIDALIHQVQTFTTPPNFHRQESFGVVVTKDMENTTPLQDDPASSRNTIVTGDYCMVPELEWNGVAVIGNILAQSVALDSYSDKVDMLLADFAALNSSVASTGSITTKRFLFKTVAQNNSIFIDMISKMRILDRSDTAWNLVKYETIHYGLKEEFEIDDRFDNIEFKLNLIEKNAKFFLEVMHHQKSNNLEWIIVVLILLECILMCVEMSGTGEAMFGAWKEGKLWPGASDDGAVVGNANDKDVPKATDDVTPA